MHAYRWHEYYPVEGLFSFILLLLFQGKKAELKSFIVELSKEFSILSQFTSFVAIEKRVTIHILLLKQTTPTTVTNLYL